MQIENIIISNHSLQKRFKTMQFDEYNYSHIVAKFFVIVCNFMLFQRKLKPTLT